MGSSSTIGNGIRLYRYDVKVIYDISGVGAVELDGLRTMFLMELAC